jgi:hypothetical protein
VGYGPFSVWAIHKEGLCPSSGDINRLMMMMMIYSRHSRLFSPKEAFTRLVLYINTTHALSAKEKLTRRYSSETPTLYQNYLAMSKTADVICGKLITVWLQSISGVSAINPLVAFYDIHGGKREVLFFYFVPDTTRDK